MSTPLAIQSSVMVCDKGTAFIPLAGISGSVQFGGLAAAVITDSVAGSNILSFAVCSITNLPCVPKPSGNWLNPFASTLLIKNTETLVEGAKLPCSVGGTILLVSAAQATVLVAANTSKVLLAAANAVNDARKLILAFSTVNEVNQNPLFKGIVCNRFVVAAYRAAGINLEYTPNEPYNPYVPNIHKAIIRDPVVSELADSENFSDVLSAPKKFQDADEGDILIWSGGDVSDHAGLLVNKSGNDPKKWEVVSAGREKGDILKRITIGEANDQFKQSPVARGPRKG